MSWEEQEEKLNKLQQNTQHLLKEARDKSRGWESHPAPESVELASKKVNTGNETSWPAEDSKEIQTVKMSNSI